MKVTELRKLTGLHWVTVHRNTEWAHQGVRLRRYGDTWVARTQYGRPKVQAQGSTPVDALAAYHVARAAEDEALARVRPAEAGEETRDAR